MAPGNSHSRNPHVCASCSSLLDGMDDEPSPPVPSQDAPSESAPSIVEMPVHEHDHRPA